MDRLSRKSSIVSPLSRKSISESTGTRVLQYRVPPRTRVRMTQSVSGQLTSVRNSLAHAVVEATALSAPQRFLKHRTTRSRRSPRARCAPSGYVAELGCPKRSPCITATRAHVSAAPMSAANRRRRSLGHRLGPTTLQTNATRGGSVSQTFCIGGESKARQSPCRSSPHQSHEY